MRLDKFLSNAGIGSRKEVKTLIKQERVRVNNHIIKSEKFNIDENVDEVFLDDERIIYQDFYYFLLNKPKNYVSSTKMERNYPPVTDLVSEYDFVDLFPVGRLDVDTTGVLILTNNGTLAHRLISPKFEVDKTYLVETDYPIQKEMIIAFEKGVMLDDEKLLPAKLEILDDNIGRVTIHQGKYHQVKRMFARYGLTVISLEREKFAFLDKGNLKQGETRQLTNEEVIKLKELVNL